MNKLYVSLAIVIVFIGGIIGYALHGNGPSFGAAADCQSTTCLSGGLSITSGLLQSNGTFQVGSSGSSLSQVLATTCSLIYTNSSIIASSSTAFDCAVTGVVSTDKVFVQEATSTAAAAGWAIIGASASTTSGFVTFNIVNNTGATNNIPRNIASSTAVLIIR